jgi:Uma2 family endonuclease
MDSHSEPALATAADLESYDKGYEVIDGRVVRKAMPSWQHSRLQLRFGRLLIPFDGLAGRPGGWVFGSETIIELELHQVYLPDIAGWRIERAPDPDTRIVCVPPDWVCELLSPSTAGRDLGVKMHMYHRAQIGHYWVIHPEQQELHVFRWEDEAYRPVLTAGHMDRVRAEPFDAIELDLRELFGE